MSEKAVFLDRDDTLIEDPGYINYPDQVKLLDGVAEALIELKALGYKLIVASNQSAVAHGIVTEKVLGDIHKRLMELLAEQGATLDKIYYCPYHPDGAVKKYRRQSNLRKPKPGMLFTAAQELDIELSESWLIGDRERDIQAGVLAGCKTILINNPSYYKQYRPGEAQPDYRCVNLREAVNIIKKHHRSGQEQAVNPTPVYQPPSAEPVETSEMPVQPQDDEQKQPQPERQEPEQPLPEPKKQQPGQDTEQLLVAIIQQLKSMQRSEMFGEFSVMRLLAGVVQIIVLFCLVATIWLLLAPNRQDSSVFIAIGFAVLFQLMSLTFYLMHGRK